MARAVLSAPGGPQWCGRSSVLWVIGRVRTGSLLEPTACVGLSRPCPLSLLQTSHLCRDHHSVSG